VIEKTYKRIGLGESQILAYLAMVRVHRINENKENTTLYGIVTDYENFEFYELSHEGRWFDLPLHTSSTPMQKIADLIAEFAFKAAMQSRSSRNRCSHDSLYFWPKLAQASGFR